VASVTVCDKLEEDRAFTVECPLASVLDGLVGSDDIHSVDLVVPNESRRYRVHGKTDVLGYRG
jgi:hypothetical protein